VTATDETPELAAFRAEARTWLEAHAPRRSPDADDWSRFHFFGDPSPEADAEHVRRCREWQRTLYDGGWAGITWPKEYGGRGGTSAEARIFAQEQSHFDVQAGAFAVGIGMVGPTLIVHGTEAQKERYLPAMLRGDEVWCQLFSEPGAGSDLAGLRTRAERDGDEWVVNGQKVWTTHAHHAQWCFAVVRTDPAAPAHKGISYLLLPMKQDGVSIRPLKQMTGSAEFNEVFFDDARTDKENVVGEVNDGWKVAMATLGFERGTAFLAQQIAFQREVTDLIQVAHKNGATDDPTVRQELSDAYIGVQIMKYNGLRMLTKLVKTGVLGPEASIGKLYWSSWHRRLGEIAMHVLGTDGLVVGGEPGGEYALDELHRTFMVSRSETIYAGASEIQRNIIGERVLGLPREPRA
jgi:alkylation response protein AidB-like acyl-CoA dehydrogenase